jgi:hypothetical protein
MRATAAAAGASNGVSRGGQGAAAGAVGAGPGGGGANVHVGTSHGDNDGFFQLNCMNPFCRLGHCRLGQCSRSHCRNPSCRPDPCNNPSCRHSHCPLGHCCNRGDNRLCTACEEERPVHSLFAAPFQLIEREPESWEVKTLCAELLGTLQTAIFKKYGTTIKKLQVCMLELSTEVGKQQDDALDQGSCVSSIGLASRLFGEEMALVRGGRGVYTSLAISYRIEPCFILVIPSLLLHPTPPTHTDTPTDS